MGGGGGVGGGGLGLRFSKIITSTNETKHACQNVFAMVTSCCNYLKVSHPNISK